MSITEIVYLLMIPIFFALGLVVGLYLENPKSWYEQHFDKSMKQVSDFREQVEVRNDIIEDLFNIIRSSGIPEDKLAEVKNIIERL